METESTLRVAVDAVIGLSVAGLFLVPMFVYRFCRRTFGAKPERWHEITRRLMKFLENGEDKPWVLLKANNYCKTVEWSFATVSFNQSERESFCFSVKVDHVEIDQLVPPKEYKMIIKRLDEMVKPVMAKRQTETRQAEVATVLRSLA